MAGLYWGHLLECPVIRVDCFTSPTPTKPRHLPHPTDPKAPRQPAPNAQLYLLTHVHTDHLVGLTQDFTGQIICSHDTKRLLPRLEAETDRINYHNGHREVLRTKYEALGPQMRFGPSNGKRVVVDRIEGRPYGEPKDYEVFCDGQAITVTITLLDANHCPGSTMFLITTPEWSVLHTGDVRADESFMRNLQRTPVLQAYIPPAADLGTTTNTLRRRLDRIYIDTSALMSFSDMGTKESALSRVVSIMAKYPPDTAFFLDVWTLGWEDVIKEVARSFDAPVHVDRYKKSLFATIKSDPFLFNCTTTDASVTRFHACERYFRCDVCKGDKNDQDRLVVNVLMTEVGIAKCDMMFQDFVDRYDAMAAGRVPWPTEILVPVARHASLLELRSLVKFLQPRAMLPNTVLDKELKDAISFSDLFLDTVPKEVLEGSLKYTKDYCTRVKGMDPRVFKAKRDDPFRRTMVKTFLSVDTSSTVPGERKFNMQAATEELHRLGLEVDRGPRPVDPYSLNPPPRPPKAGGPAPSPPRPPSRHNAAPAAPSNAPSPPRSQAAISTSLETEQERIISVASTTIRQPAPSSSLKRRRESAFRVDVAHLQSLLD